MYSGEECSVSLGVRKPRGFAVVVGSGPVCEDGLTARPLTTWAQREATETVGGSHKELI